MKILGIYDHSGPKYHRIMLPLALMDEAQYELAGGIQEEIVKDIDIIFFNRMIGKVSLNQLLTLRTKYGFKLICDLDDHWNLDPSHLLYHQYKHFSTSEIIEACIKESDCILVTHERLYNEVLKINTNVHIVPNAIPKAGQFLFKKIKEDKIRLFWAGGITHKKDLDILRNPARRINTPSVKWVMGGYQQNHKEAHVNEEWRWMAKIFNQGGSFDCELIEAIPVETYYGCYSKCDISLVPLVDNSFNCYKSNLKILEAANIAAPVIVSRVNPYLGFPEHLINYVSKQSDWYLHTANLIRNPVFLKEQGEQLKEHCDINYNFDRINELRKQIFEHETGKRN